MSIKAVFWDIDNTILDYEKCSERASEAVCYRLGTEYSAEILNSFRQIDERLWKYQNREEITVEEVFQKHAEEMLAVMGQSLPDEAFADTFAEELGETAELVEGVEAGMIAKTMSFLQDGQAVLILTEGTARIDNRKYKATFYMKAKMIPFEEVEQWSGHDPGGVCPFGIHDDVDVYLDESLRQFETVYPAAGDDHSAVRLSVDELEQIAGAKG